MVIKLDDIVKETRVAEEKLADEIENKIDEDLVRAGGEELLNGKPITVTFGQDVNKRIADKLVEKYKEINPDYNIICKMYESGNYSELIISRKKEIR